MQKELKLISTKRLDAIDISNRGRSRTSNDNPESISNIEAGLLGVVMVLIFLITLIIPI